MILYHFCCERDMRGIRNHGISKGVLYTEDKGKKPGQYRPHIVANWQWLTLDGRKEAQSWNTHVLLPYDRTEYRWTVEIPDNMTDSLYDRDGLKALFPFTEMLFDGWDGSENWRVHHGPIPKRWLKKLEYWNKQTDQWEDVPRGR